jgi:hypothetical protein
MHHQANPDQERLFEATPEGFVATAAEDTPSDPELEKDLERLDEQGQTSVHVQLGRLGVGRDESDGQLYEEPFPVARPRRSRPSPKNPRTRTARELRVADQPPAHERHDF